MVSETIHAVSLLTSAVLALGTVAWVQARGRGEAARLYIYTMSLAAVWAGLIALSLWDPVEANSFASHLVHLLRKYAIWSVAMMWFLFVLVYSGRKSWLSKPAFLRSVYSKPLFGFMLAELVIAVVLAGTNPFHELIWESGYSTQTGYGIHIFFVYVYFFVGIIVLYRHFLTTRHSARKQTLALMVGVAVPLGLNIAANLDVLTQDLKWSAVAVGAFAACVGWGAFSQQLFTTAPLARDTVLELIDDGIIVVDPEWRIVDYNASAASAYPSLTGGIGQEIDEVVPSLVADEDAGPEERFAEQVFVTGPEEGRVEYDVTVSPLTQENSDSARGYALVMEDVTDVEQYQTRVEQQNKRLEHVAKTISHDLRNPVNVASGFVDIAKEKEDFSKLDRVERAIDRIDEITDEVLTLARQEQSIGDREPVKLEAVARQSWQMSDTADASLDVAVGSEHVYADRERLQTALENLFRNAVDHGPDDVRVRVGRHAGGFYVEDTGPGIPEGERDEVFEYEYTTAEEGTGLGLFTVQTVAEGHGWQVRATEGSEDGARFEFDEVSFIADTSDAEESVLRSATG